MSNVTTEYDNIDQWIKPGRPRKDLSSILNDLAKQVKVLENYHFEICNIRGTLLVNFGDGPCNRNGFVVADEGSTCRVMINVLEKLTEKTRKFDAGNNANLGVY